MPKKLIEFITRDGQKAAKGSTDVTMPAAGGPKDATITIEALEKITRIVEIKISTPTDNYRPAYYPQNISIENNKVSLKVDATSDSADTTMTVEVTALGT